MKSIKDLKSISNENSLAIQLSNVSKAFGKIIAVDSVSFSAPTGSITCLLGPSGCGKTTTLRLITGFEYPDHGKISISGRRMSNERPYERNVGLLFQDYALFPHMTVLENVCYGLRYRSFSKENVKTRAREMLNLVKLDHLEDRYPTRLSGGQQQRVALARALATDPELLLLDEPLSALDAKLRDQLRIELKDIIREVGTTTIVVTHDQEEAMSLGDNIIVMNEGRIAQHGTPSEIYTKPKSRFVADFVGRSNWFPAVVLEQSTTGFITAKLANGLVVRARGLELNANAECEIFVRPEHLTVNVSEDAHARCSQSANVLTGSVRDISFLGADVHIVLDIDAIGPINIVTKDRSAVSIRRSQLLSVGFSSEDCIAFP